PLYLSMIPRVEPAGMLFRKPLHAFPDHALYFSMILTENRCTLFRDHAYENRIVDSFLRPSTVASSAPPHASNNCTSCLRAPSSFHLRSRLTIVSNWSVASARLPCAFSAVARSKRA